LALLWTKASPKALIRRKRRKTADREPLNARLQAHLGKEEGEVREDI